MTDLQRDWINERARELEARPVWIGGGNIRRLADEQLQSALNAGYEATPYPWRPKLWQQWAAVEAGYQFIDC